jgi:hypothetical protein
MEAETIKNEIAELRAKYMRATAHAERLSEGYGQAGDFGFWTPADETALSSACKRLADVEFAAGGWSATTTADRRARWNAAMQVPGVDISHAAIAKLEKSLGFLRADLLKAVRLYA